LSILAEAYVSRAGVVALRITVGTLRTIVGSFLTDSITGCIRCYVVAYESST